MITISDIFDVFSYVFFILLIVGVRFLVNYFISSKIHHRRIEFVFGISINHLFGFFISLVRRFDFNFKNDVFWLLILTFQSTIFYYFVNDQKSNSVQFFLSLSILFSVVGLGIAIGLYLDEKNQNNQIFKNVARKLSIGVSIQIIILSSMLFFFVFSENIVNKSEFYTPFLKLFILITSTFMGPFLYFKDAVSRKAWTIRSLVQSVQHSNWILVVVHFVLYDGSFIKSKPGFLTFFISFLILFISDYVILTLPKIKRSFRVNLGYYFLLPISIFMLIGLIELR